MFGRLRWFLVIMFSGGGATSFALAWAFWTAAANEAYDRLLISAAVQIAETLDVERGGFVVNPPDAAFETLALADGDRLFYAVRDPRGRVLTGDPQLAAEVPAVETALPVLGSLHFAGVSVSAASVGRFLSVPGMEGWCSVVVAQTRAARHALAMSQMVRTGVLIAFIATLGFFASMAAVRRALRPLERIEKVLDARSSHDVTPLLVASPRETQALVNTINKVMAQFANRMVKLEQFTATAAHQIRTPLSALGSQLELLEQAQDAAERGSRITRLRHRVNELARLTHQLLGHAMITYRSDVVPHERIDLVELARHALADGVPMALDRDLGVMFDAPEGEILVNGDAVGLKEGLTNLINNALVHGAPATLRVRVWRDKHQAGVAVFDDGPGMPPHLWDAALKAFSVERGSGSGAGLGLSIVNDIAQAHGGAVTFALPPGGGFEVQIVLPLHSAQGQR